MPENVSVIVGLPSVYDNALPGWRSRFQAMTRGGVAEKIWMNYPEGRAYSHAFAGKDYNDRYRLSESAALEGEICGVTAAERLAIMVALKKGSGVKMHVFVQNIAQICTIFETSFLPAAPALAGLGGLQKCTKRGI
jgi:hypothetical protein